MDDEATVALKTVRAGKISAWTVFVARVLLDIQEVIGSELKNAYDQLRDTASTVIKTLDFKLIDGTLHPPGEGWLARTVMSFFSCTILSQIGYLQISFLGSKLGWLADHSGGQKCVMWDDASPECKEYISNFLQAKGSNYSLRNPCRGNTAIQRSGPKGNRASCGWCIYSQKIIEETLRLSGSHP